MDYYLFNQRKCSYHDGYIIKKACFNETCNLNKLVCRKCEDSHKDHPNDLLGE